jgi:uncharacterized membrane protein YeiB
MRPVSAGERIEVLDALRGAALFGIMVVPDWRSARRNRNQSA